MKTPSIRVELRKDKKAKDGLCPIYLIIGNYYFRGFFAIDAKI